MNLQHAKHIAKFINRRLNATYPQQGGVMVVERVNPQMVIDANKDWEREESRKEQCKSHGRNFEKNCSRCRYLLQQVSK